MGIEFSHKQAKRRSSPSRKRNSFKPHLFPCHRSIQPTCYKQLPKSQMPVNYSRYTMLWLSPAYLWRMKTTRPGRRWPCCRKSWSGSKAWKEGKKMTSTWTVCFCFLGSFVMKMFTFVLFQFFSLGSVEFYFPFAQEQVTRTDGLFSGKVLY